MDLDDPSRASVVGAVGVTTLLFEPALGTRFMAGMENGVVVNVNPKAASPMDKLTARLDCHAGPVVAVDRNPSALKYFLTVGDRTVKIWADDTKEGSLITIRLDRLRLIALNFAFGFTKRRVFAMCITRVIYCYFRNYIHYFGHRRYSICTLLSRTREIYINVVQAAPI